MTNERFLTREWNNWLTLGLGLPTLAFGITILSTSFVSDFTGFIMMVILGAVY